MNDEKINRLTIDAAFRIDDGTLVADAVSHALRALAAGYEVEVARLRERLAAAERAAKVVIGDHSNACACHACSHLTSFLAQSPASESAKPCQFDGDGRCEWHTHQPAPDVTAHELLNNRINALNVQLAEVRTGYAKLEARVKAIEPAFRTEPAVQVPVAICPRPDCLHPLDRHQFGGPGVCSFCDCKPVPEPPLVNHAFVHAIEDGITKHTRWLGTERLCMFQDCGLPESAHRGGK